MYHQDEFGILGTGQMSGNLSELQSQSFDVFVFDDPGYASFRDGSNSLPPLFEKSGTHIVFDFGLAGPGNYHVVIVGSPTRQPLQVHVELTVVGLKTGDTLLALVVLVGGLGLMAASLMLSVGAWRRALTAPAPTPEPPPDPAREPALRSVAWCPGSDARHARRQTPGLPIRRPAPTQVVIPARTKEQETATDGVQFQEDVNVRKNIFLSRSGTSVSSTGAADPREPRARKAALMILFVGILVLAFAA